MGHLSISALGCVASIILLLQLGLHTQLLQKRSGGSTNVTLTDDSVNQYSSPQSLISSNKILSTISQNTRNKRFLAKPNDSNDNYDRSGGSSAATSEEERDKSDSVSPSENTNRLPNSSVKRNPWKGVSSELLISNFYTGDFILPNAQLCNRKGENLTLVILVPSAISNFQQRNSVRNTWGSFSIRRDVAVGFVIGDPKLSQTNKTVLDLFQKEIDLFGDIIIADMKDSYKNLTLKVLYMLEWGSTYCYNARFFMKTDDDVFLNVPLVLDFISKIEKSDSEKPKIYGNVFSGHMPKRNTTHKHFVNYQVYPHEIQYPNFTSGPAYLVSSKVLRPLLKQAVHLPLFNLEDVFLTGFVASSLDIPRVNVTQFRNELENPFDMPMCKVVKTIAGMTDGSPPQIYYVWYNYLMGKVICNHLTRFNR